MALQGGASVAPNQCLGPVHLIFVPQSSRLVLLVLLVHAGLGKKQIWTVPTWDAKKFNYNGRKALDRLAVQWGLGRRPRCWLKHSAGT